MDKADEYLQSETIQTLKETVEELRRQRHSVIEDRDRLLVWIADLQAGETCCPKCGRNYGQTDRPILQAHKDCPFGPHSAEDTAGKS